MANKESKLSIIVDAQDKTSAGLNAVKKGLDNTQVSVEGITEAMSAVGKVGAVAFGALSVGVGVAINEATEANKVIAQLEAVLGSTAGKAGVTKEAATNLANELSRMTLYSDDAVLSAENMLLTFTNIGKDVFPTATETVLNMSTALGQDLQSSAVQLGKALNDPIDGISALSRVGVTFNDDQKAMIETMVEAGDVMGAQKIILAELATEFGNSAAKAAEADPFGVMKNQMSELTETIGTALLPVFQQLIEAVTPVILKITEWVQENPKLTEAILIVAGVITGLMAIMLPLSLIMPALVATFTGLAAVFTFLATGPGMLFIGFAVVLIYTISQISGIVKILANDWDTVWLGMQLSVAETVNGIVGFVQSMIDFVVQGVNSLIQIVNNLLDRLSSIPKIGDKFADMKIDEIQAIQLQTIDTGAITDSFVSSQTPPQNTEVNVTGNVLLSDDIAELLGDGIINQLQLSTQL